MSSVNPKISNEIAAVMIAATVRVTLRDVLPRAAGNLEEIYAFKATA